MLLRVNGQYLDFNDDIEMEKLCKLFEELDTTAGDFSYSFELPKTSKNMDIFGSPLPDVSSKIIYNNVLCDIIDIDGLPIYTGKLRVQNIKNFIEVSFFSGNYNWISLLTGAVSDLDFSAYDYELTEDNIVNAMVNTDGINFPVIDTGGLITRGHKNLRIEDFNACMFVKTIFNKIFNSAGLKIKGDLFNEWRYNNLLICKNNKSREEIDNYSSYVQKTSTTSRPGENVDYKITFQNDSTYPYYDGAGDAFDLTNSRWIAPATMIITIECTLTPSIVDASYNNRIYIYINGVFTFVDIGLNDGGLYNAPTPGDRDTFTIKRNIYVETGDIIEIYSEWQQSLGNTQNDVISGTLKITPVFIYKVYGKSIVPNWTKQYFVSQILNIFNVVTDYNPYTKEITFNLFDKINTKEAIDISNYITVNDVNFAELISSFGKMNIFKYQPSDEEELRDYNVTKFIKYGEGVIEIDNDFIPDSVPIIDSGFTAPISYINGVFQASLERIKIFDYTETENIEFTSVTDSGGNARFVIPSNPFQRLDLVRISESTNPEYNGDWVINANSTTYLQVQGCNFKTDATGKITKIVHSYTDNDNVYLLINIPFYDVDKFSGFSNYLFIENTRAELSYGYFNILNTGRVINSDFKESLSFGATSSPFNYQRTLIDSYWRSVTKVLNDPVKLRCTAYFPKSVFLSLTPLRPVYIKTKESTNLYYINRITGYKASHLPCEIELIKL